MDAKPRELYLLFRGFKVSSIPVQTISVLNDIPFIRQTNTIQSLYMYSANHHRKGIDYGLVHRTGSYLPPCITPFCAKSLHPHGLGAVVYQVTTPQLLMLYVVISQ
ncbi:unnamed protein product [Echinostoma caproni]|uniref:Uncharacterized protein n=1 Tax=Echinostoma caproni TaxID=27848 RepID=A0A3P8GT38_9TREM|nr:unnamed protein product [Echinostoma caproni]